MDLFTWPVTYQCVVFGAPLPQPPPEPSLYERLGGIFEIAKIVNHFSDTLVDNPVAGKNSPNPQLREWYETKLDRLSGLKFMRTLWLAARAGGPFTFSPTKPGKCPFGLENSHKEFKISSDEFNAVATELSLALDHFNVPEKEKHEVLMTFAAHKDEVVTGMPPVKC